MLSEINTRGTTLNFSLRYVRSCAPEFVCILYEFFKHTETNDAQMSQKTRPEIARSARRVPRQITPHIHECGARNVLGRIRCFPQCDRIK